MPPMVFAPRKDSNLMYPSFARDFHGFYQARKGSDASLDLDLEQFTNGLDCRMKKTTVKKIKKLLDKFKNAKSETATSIYIPMSRILTLISMDIAPLDGDVLVFVRNVSSVMKVEDTTSDDHNPDLVAFMASRDVAKKVANGKKVAVPSAYKIVTVVEMKLDNAAIPHCRCHMLIVSRHRPNSSWQYGLVVNRRYFQLLASGLDTEMEWGRVEWTSDAALNILYSCVDLIRIEATRPLDAAIPSIIDVHEQKGAVFTFRKAMIGGRLFRLLPLSTSRSRGCKPFVALAVEKENPSNVRVFKYSWYKGIQHGKERSFLRRLKNAPGVVQIDDELSLDSLENDERSGRVRSLLVLKTIGHPLCSCSSVREFLEAMYDLLEVLRYHVQEKKILHRDISWGNVLIRPQHSSDAKVEIRSEPTDEAIKHRYRFISDIFGEEEHRIRVALADFDHAADLSNGRSDELRDATGTPMFMANDVMYPRPYVKGGCIFQDACEELRRASEADCEMKYDNAEEKEEWDKFYSHLEEIRWGRNDNAEESFQHGAVHDAESVFCLCLLFFNRMWRKCPLEGDKGNPNIAGGERVEALTALVSKRVRTSPINLGYFCDPINGFDDSFGNILDTINDYVVSPWKDIPNTGRGERYEFHLHDFMQRVILKELHKLGNQDISIDEKPLRIISSELVSGKDFTNCCNQIASVLGKRKEVDSDQSDSSSLVMPDHQVKGFLKHEGGFPLSFWDIRREKQLERLWLILDNIV